MASWWTKDWMPPARGGKSLVTMRTRRRAAATGPSCPTRSVPRSADGAGHQPDELIEAAIGKHGPCGQHQPGPTSHGVPGTWPRRLNRADDDGRHYLRAGRDARAL